MGRAHISQMTTNRPRKPTFRLTLEALPKQDGSDPDGILRLRSILKSLLRSWSFKCVRVEPAPDAPEPRVPDSDYAYPLTDENDADKA